ncbi:MAG: hypothetical protein IT518_02775 [Burkholderiales bacterium]|nr:hypothetical protein [Burkholderiales bacterium]
MMDFRPDFATWLDTGRIEGAANAMRCLLIECEYRDLVTGTAGVEYLSTMPFVSNPGDSPPNTAYRAVVTKVPGFRQAMSDFMTGRSAANVGTVEILAAEDGTMDAWIDASRDYIGRSVRIYIGDPAWSRQRFESTWVGVMAAISISGTNKVTLEIRDQQHLLSEPIARTVFSATQFLQSANYGETYPLTFGLCRNVHPVMQMVATAPGVYTYFFYVHDGPVQAIDTVRIHGLPIPTNQYTTYPELGYFTINVAGNIDGYVTADVRGEVDPATGYWYSTPAEIMQRILRRSKLSAIPADFSALANKCPQVLGIAIPSGEVVTVAAALDMVVTSVGGFYSTARDGTLFAGRVDFDNDPVLDIGPEQMVERGLSIAAVMQPRSSYIVTYDNNVTRNPGNLAPPDPYLDPAMDPDTRAWLEKGHRLARYDNPNIANFAKVNPDKVRLAYFTTREDAYAEAQRLMGLFGSLRLVVDVRCFLAPMALSIGNTIRIIHTRYGFATSRKAVIIGIAEEWGKKMITLRALVQ